MYRISQQGLEHSQKDLQKPALTLQKRSSPNIFFFFLMCNSDLSLFHDDVNSTNEKESITSFDSVLTFMCDPESDVFLNPADVTVLLTFSSELMWFFSHWACKCPVCPLCFSFQPGLWNSTYGTKVRNLQGSKAMNSLKSDQ